MRIDELRKQMNAWGIASVNRYAYSRSDLSTHQLARAVEVAPGTMAKAAKRLADRDGRSRRAFMATAATHGTAMRMQAIPKWACEPVRAANDADPPRDHPENAVDQGIPDELRWIESALSQLSRESLLRAIIVRTEFTHSCSQTRKAVIACDEYVKKMAELMGVAPPTLKDGQRPALNARQYREELDRALHWIAGARKAA